MKGGNDSCPPRLNTYLGIPDQEIESIRRAVGDVRDGGAASASPSAAESECPRICRFRASRERWEANHEGIADCGWVGSGCPHHRALLGGFISMPAPECHLYYFKLFSHVAMSVDERVHLIYSDIGCQLGWQAYAADAYLHDPEAYKRAIDLVIKVGWWHATGHAESCQLLNSALYHPGAGRTVGEQMEPMWQRFAPLIDTFRRCTADRRKDFFSHAVHQHNEEMEPGTFKMLKDNLRLALAKKKRLDKTITEVLVDAAALLCLTLPAAAPSLLLPLLLGWANDLTAIQTLSEDASARPDWRAEWVVKRVQLGHVAGLVKAEGEATLRLLFPSGGSPLVASVDKLSDAVDKLEQANSDAIYAAGWSNPDTAVLRATPSFAAAFEAARTALVKCFERSAARFVCAIASVDEILKRRVLNTSAISFAGLKASRLKHLEALTRQLTLRQWWASFSLADNGPTADWKAGLPTLTTEVLKGPPLPWDAADAAVPAPAASQTAPPASFGSAEHPAITLARARRHQLPLSIIMRLRTLDAELKRTVEAIDIVPVEEERAKRCVLWSRTRAGEEIGARALELSELKQRGGALDVAATPLKDANQLFSRIKELEGELLILRGRSAQLDDLYRDFTPSTLARFSSRIATLNPNGTRGTKRPRLYKPSQRR